MKQMATEEDSVVNRDSCAEYVIFHSDRHFLRHIHMHTPRSVLGRQRKTDDEPKICFRHEEERQKHLIMAHLF